MRRFLAVATAIGCLMMRSHADAAAPHARTEAGREWVSAWATALQAIPEGEGLPALYRAPEVAGRTVRQIIVPSLDGRLARVRISNAFAREPLVIAEARIALGGVALKPWRARTAEAALAGARPEQAAFRRAAEAALADARPSGDNAFKIELARRIVVRALSLAAAGTPARISALPASPFSGAITHA